MLLKREQLHKYQVRGHRHILDNFYAGLFMDMGLGKTVTTLTAINELMYFELDITSVLVIATKKIVESVWKEECDSWEHLRHLKVSKVTGTQKQRLQALNVKADVYLISRDNIHWLCELFKYKLPYDMLVVDESSSFKNQKSKRFKALRKVAPKFRRRVILTGTPAPNGLLDLWAQVYILDQGERLEKFKTHYQDIYFKPDKRNGSTIFSYKLKKQADVVIHNKISDIVISMKSEDYLDLPDKINHYPNLELTPVLRKKYDEFAKEQVMILVNFIEDMRGLADADTTVDLYQFTEDIEEGVTQSKLIDRLEAEVETVTLLDGQILIRSGNDKVRYEIINRLKNFGIRELKTPEDVSDWKASKIKVGIFKPKSEAEIIALNAAALTIKLQQFTSGAIYDEDRTVHHIHDTKLDYLEELVEAATFTQEQILVAWNFQHERDRIMERLKNFGAKEIKTPEDVISWNSKKIPVGLLHPKSGGHGLNLQKGGAHIIFWFSPTWDLELYLQFNARLARQGNSHAVMIYHPVVPDTVDTRIIKSLGGKHQTQEALMLAVKAIIKEYGRN